MDVTMTSGDFPPPPSPPPPPHSPPPPPPILHLLFPSTFLVNGLNFAAIASGTYPITVKRIAGSAGMRVVHKSGLLAPQWQ